MTEEAGGASPGIAEESQGRGPPGGHASLRSFENAVSARLLHPGNASTLGCELQFVQMNSLQVLADSIQSAICTNQKCCAIAEQCMVEAGHKGQLKGEVKAVRVLRSRMAKFLHKPFPFALKFVMFQ